MRSHSIRTLSLVAMLSVAGCPGPEPTPDGGADAAGPDAGRCTTTAECDDGLFCNGDESCTGGRCVAGTPPACRDESSCTTDRCSEERVRCENLAPDEDGDGYGDVTCLGDDGSPAGNDCDDDDALRFPGNAEVCDLAGRDEDCDATTIGGRDADGDGYVSAECCNPGASGATCGDDCRDTLASAFPMAPELCNGIDDDCDTRIDEGALVLLYADGDHDGYGAGTGTMGCPGTTDRVTRDGDCDDTMVARSPGQPEFCDGIDNDCNEDVDDFTRAIDWFLDADGDGFGSPSDATSSCTPIAGRSILGTDCDDTTNARSPATVELCNAIDDDCNPTSAFEIAAGDFEDDDGDRAPDLACGGVAVDCDDEDATTTGGSLELCDGRDNDCDDAIDEGAAGIVYYRDGDMDGFGSDVGGAAVGCLVPRGFAARGGDCDDRDPDRSPSATETCDGIDDDCDRTLDEAPATAMCGTPAGTTASVCVLGRCSPRCVAGRADCNGTFTDGCEVDLDADAAHCGSCARSCGTVPNGTYTCSGGDCIVTCASGRLDCNADPSDGCERVGATCPMCPASLPDCDGDGTCDDVSDDPANCGACGNVCGVAGVCVDGACDAVVAIATGATHTCALRAAGGIACWGANGSGQLGVTGTPSGVVSVATMEPAVAIAAGASHTCALLVSGRVECWGSDAEGELGDGAGSPALGTHAVVTLPTPATTIAAGAHHTFVLANATTAYGWGRNDEGEIDATPGADRLSPTPITFSFVETNGIAAGGAFTCVRESLTIVGFGTLPPYFTTTLGMRGTIFAKSGSPYVESVTAGEDHACFGDGTTILCLGDDSLGRLGAAASFTDPVVSSLRGRALGGAIRTTCALSSLGVLSCVGDNTNGALGTAAGGSSITPVAVPTIPRATAVSRGAAAEHVCAVDTLNRAWCWGPNAAGQVTGTASAGIRAPTVVPGL